MEYEDIYETSRDDLEASRDASMNYLDEYYQDPEKVGLVSDSMDELLAYDSTYRTEARADSRESMETAGYLQSDFMDDTGDAAAIDSSYDVAMQDTAVDVYNAEATNYANYSEYAAAYGFTMDALKSQGEQTNDEFDYALSTGLVEQRADNLNELYDVWAQYNIERAENDAVNLQDKVNLAATNYTASELMKQTSDLDSTYLSSYSEIITGDISQADKYDQLEALGYNLDAAKESLLGYIDLAVGSNPYSIALDYYYQTPDIGDRTDPQYNWTIDDATVLWYGSAYDIIHEIDVAIHEQTNHGERNEYEAYADLEDVRDLMPALLRDFPENATDVMEWWDRQGEDLVYDDKWEQAVAVWSDLILTANGRTASLRNPNERGETIQRPYSYIGTVWNSETQTVGKETIEVDGNAAYYEELERQASGYYYSG